MPTTTNYGWTTPADTDLVKDGAAAIRTLGTAIDTTVFNNASAAIAKTIVDAKGDLIVASGSDTVARLAVGTNDYVLTADSAATNGIKWAALPASGGMTLISETVASTLSSLSFSSLGSYKQLILYWQGIYCSDGSEFRIRLNNDSTASIYAMNSLGGSTTVAIDKREENNILPAISSFADKIQSTDPVNMGRGFLMIDNYTATNRFKRFQGMNSYRNSTAGTDALSIYTGTYKSTSAITSIDIVRFSGTGTFSNDSNYSIRLYGVS